MLQRGRLASGVRRQCFHRRRRQQFGSPQTTRRRGDPKATIRTDPDTEFLRSTDNWFRPVQFSVGPDGSLLILDMYRETIEHPASLPDMIRRHLDLASGNDRGRIYRVVPIGFKTPQRKFPGEASVEELVDMLGHPNAWHRSTAARLLYERQPKTAPALLKQKGLTSPNPEMRIRAMYLLADQSALAADDLARLLADSHPYVRIHGLRVFERFANDAKLVAVVCNMTNDPDPRVRFFVALALAHLDAEQVPQAIARLASQDGSNEWMASALAIASVHRRAEVIQALLDLTKQHKPLVDQIQPLLRELVRQANRQSDKAELSVIVGALANESDFDPDVLSGMLLELTGGSETQASAVRETANSLGVSLSEWVDKAGAHSLSTALDEHTEMARRIDAVSALRLLPAERFLPAFAELLELKQPPEIRSAALSTAETFTTDAIAPVILRHLPEVSPELRRQSLQVLLARPSWTMQLLDGIESGAINRVLLDASTRQRLLRHAETSISDRAAVVLGGDQHSDRAAVVQSYSQQLQSLTGDAARGREVFRKTCVACHRLENVGTEIGPNLAAFANRGAEAILLNLLDPNREVDPRYLAFNVLMIDGRTISGIIASETATAITLQNTEGKSQTISRDEIEEMRSTTVSLMPENLENDVPPQAMADLIEYLLSQRQ